MNKTITIRDHHVPGPYPRTYRPEFEMKPGGLTYIDVAPGFDYRVDARGTLIIYPKWWRRLKHFLTGKW